MENHSVSLYDYSDESLKKTEAGFCFGLLQNLGGTMWASSPTDTKGKKITGLAKISLTAHLLGGAKEIEKPQIDKLLYLREKYYGVTGKHPGYKHYNKGN